MNYIVIGALGAAAAIIIGLVIRLFITKHKIKKDKLDCQKRKELLAKRDHEIMEDTAKILEKLPPVNGPEPDPEPDYDNGYTPRNIEPVVIAEKDDITELAENLGECDEHGNVVTDPNKRMIPTKPVIDKKLLETVGLAVAALEPKKAKKKKSAKKTTKTTTKKTVKKIKRFADVKVVEEVEKPKRKYTRKKKVAE